MSDPTMRLDRLIANMGYGSRREVGILAHNRRIMLDGAPLLDADVRIALTPDLPSRLMVNGVFLDPLPGMVVMLNKPVGVTCSHKEAGRLVYDLFPERWNRREPKLSSIGRLDKETSGLLLLTDDGGMLHKVISPKSGIAKKYFVTLERPLQGNEIALFAAGTLMLENEDKPLLPVAMEVLTPATARVTLHEGRYHQVRRMFAAVDNHVIALHRETVGGLDLPLDMNPGDYRLLTPVDCAQIFSHNTKC